jgi:hypothetical protein
MALTLRPKRNLDAEGNGPEKTEIGQTASKDTGIPSAKSIKGVCNGMKRHPRVK